MSKKNFQEEINDCVMYEEKFDDKWGGLVLTFQSCTQSIPRVARGGASSDSNCDILFINLSFQFTSSRILPDGANVHGCQDTTGLQMHF